MSSSSAEPTEEGTEEKKDALDEWVDELDRLIGIEPMTEEEIAEQQHAAQQQKKKHVDFLPFLVIAIIILAVIALLFYLHVI